MREPCLEWALEVGVDDGIFGGLTARERRTLKRRSRVSVRVIARDGST